MPRNKYPHAKISKALRPVREFSIQGQWYSLYLVEGRAESNPYSLYNNGQDNPVQHAMSALEVIDLLSYLTIKEADREVLDEVI